MPVCFDFKEGVLYAVWLGPVTLPSDSGEALLARLTRYYNSMLGSADSSEGQDEPYYVVDREWRAADCDVIAGESVVGGKRDVSWGYQEKIEHPPASRP